MSYLLLPAHQPGPGTELVQHIDWAPGLSGCCGSCESKGMGLFDSGLDISGWSWPEWGSIFAGLYVLISTVSTTHRAVKRVGAIPGNRRKAKAASLRKRADELTRKGGSKKKSHDY